MCVNVWQKQVRLGDCTSEQCLGDQVAEEQFHLQIPACHTEEDQNPPPETHTHTHLSNNYNTLIMLTLLV